MAFKFLIFVTVSVLINNVFSDLNKDKSFININNPIPCVRRFNATHQIGCGKLDHTSYSGIVYAVRTQKEFDRLDLLNDLNKRKLILVTVPQFFIQVVEYYKTDKSEKINGVVLLASSNYYKNFLPTNQFKSYSDDTPNPNNIFSIYSKNASYSINWNQAGKSFMFEDFKIPFYVITNETEANQSFDACYDKFNKDIFERADTNISSAENINFKIKPNDLLCGMQLGLEMYGAVSSSVCARRSNIIHTIESNSFCDPLGGSNYFTFLSQKPSNSLPIIIVSARIDSFTMYEYFTPGANEPITSIIGLLSIVETLAKFRKDMNTKNILFTLFDNEAFDYGGSSRFSNDLLLDKFPNIIIIKNETNTSFTLKKENIASMIELNQLGSVGLGQNENLFIHRDPISYVNNPNVKNIIDDLTSLLKKYSNDKILPVKNFNSPLPPSSLHSFLRQGFQIGAISISDHEKEFKNLFYHSVFDTPQSLNVTFPDNIDESEASNYTTNLAYRLQPLLTSIAKTLYTYSSNLNSTFDQKVNLTTLNKLIYCFYKNSSCSFFQSIMNDDEWKVFQSLLDSTLPKQQLSFYTSVHDNKISGKLISFLLLRYFSRNLELESFNSSECKKSSAEFNNFINKNGVTIKSLVFSKSGTCIASSVYPVSSVSPAFDKFDDGELIDIDKFSAWTESSWASTQVQMKLFMFSSDSVKTLTLSLGIISFLTSIAVIILANHYSSKWLGIKSQEQTNEIID